MDYANESVESLARSVFYGQRQLAELPVARRAKVAALLSVPKNIPGLVKITIDARTKKAFEASVLEAFGVNLDMRRKPEELFAEVEALAAERKVLLEIKK